MFALPKQQQPSKENCCAQRSAWFYRLTGALGLVAIAFCVAGSIAAFFLLGTRGFLTLHTTYITSGNFGTSTAAHLVVGSTPLTITLPGDLSNMIGSVYHFDCLGGGAHTFVFGSGGASWTGVSGQKTASCLSVPITPGGVGFSFRVLTATSVRLIDPRNVNFS
jgi:hypothetical protein